MTCCFFITETRGDLPRCRNLDDDRDRKKSRFNTVTLDGSWLAPGCCLLLFLLCAALAATRIAPAHQRLCLWPSNQYAQQARGNIACGWLRQRASSSDSPRRADAAQANPQAARLRAAMPALKPNSAGVMDSYRLAAGGHRG